LITDEGGSQPTDNRRVARGTSKRGNQYGLEFPVETILSVIAEHGPMSLGRLLDRLASSGRPAVVASAFQSARAAGLVERTGRATSDGDATYCLTPAGHVRACDFAGDEVVATDGSALPFPVILAVVDEFGEASLGLVAWELSLDESELVATWRRALDEGLLEFANDEPQLTERMARLTPLGRDQIDPRGELAV
jgi:hypothetical protein